MNILERLMSNLPPFFNISSKPLEIFSVDNVVSVKVDLDARELRIKEAIDETVIDVSSLSSYSITDLKAAIVAAGFSITTVYSHLDSLYWHTLVDKTSTSGKVYYEESLIRRLMAGIGQGVIDEVADYLNGVNQVILEYALTHWLNYWGEYFGYGRETGESDATYLRRIQKEIFKLKTTNISIAKIIQDVTGIGASIVEVIDTACTFQVRLGSEFGVIDASTRATINAIVTRNRAAGYFPAFYTLDTVLHTNETGWYDLQETTYTNVDTDTLKITNDYTDILHKNMLVIIHLSDGNKVMARVDSTSFGSGETTVNLDNTVITAGVTITAVKYQIGYGELGAATYTRVDDDTFTSDGQDDTSVCTPQVWLRILRNVSGTKTYFYTKVVSSSFSTNTTINVEDAVILADDILEVDVIEDYVTNKEEWVVCPADVWEVQGGF